MRVYYLDTSAAAKRYVDETGSAWVRAVLAANSHPMLFSAQLLRVEIISALTRRRREGIIAADDYALLRQAFAEDCQTQYQLVPIDTKIMDLACAVLERYPLRAYDAVHLATALITNRRLGASNAAPLTFLSADDRLNAAAQAEGLTVDNPNAHP